VNWIKWTESTQMKLDSLLARQDAVLERLEILARMECLVIFLIGITIGAMVFLAIRMR